MELHQSIPEQSFSKYGCGVWIYQVFRWFYFTNILVKYQNSPCLFYQIIGTVIASTDESKINQNCRSLGLSMNAVNYAALPHNLMSSAKYRSKKGCVVDTSRFSV